MLCISRTIKHGVWVLQFKPVVSIIIGDAGVGISDSEVLASFAYQLIFCSLDLSLFSPML